MTTKKGISKFIINNDTSNAPIPIQEPLYTQSESQGLFVHNANGDSPSKIFISNEQGVAEFLFDITDYSGLRIGTQVPVTTTSETSLTFQVRGDQIWRIGGSDGGDHGHFYPLLDNTYKIGDTGYNVSEAWTRKLTADSDILIAPNASDTWQFTGIDFIPVSDLTARIGRTGNTVLETYTQTALVDTVKALTNSVSIQAVSGSGIVEFQTVGSRRWLIDVDGHLKDDGTKSTGTGLYDISARIFKSQAQFGPTTVSLSMQNNSITQANGDLTITAGPGNVIVSGSTFNNGTVSVPSYISVTDTGGYVNTAGTYKMDGVDVIDVNRTFIGSGGVNTSGTINTNDRYRIDSVDVIDAARTFVGSGGVSTVGTINTDDRYRIDSVDVINTGRTFVGSGGVSVGSAAISGGAISGSSLTIDQTTIDGSTITFSGPGGGGTIENISISGSILGNVSSINFGINGDISSDTNNFKFAGTLNRAVIIESNNAGLNLNANNGPVNIGAFGSNIHFVTSGAVPIKWIINSTDTIPTLNANGQGQINADQTLYLSLDGIARWRMTSAFGGGDGSLIALGGQYVGAGGYTSDAPSAITFGPIGNNQINFIDNFGSVPRFLAIMSYNQFEFVGQHTRMYLRSSLPGPHGELVCNNFIKVFVNGGVISGTFDTTGFVDASDVRIKENISPLDPQKEKIKALNAVHYNIIGQEDVQMGLLAQELDSIYPEAVSKGDPERWGINYRMLIAPLAKALQEAFDEIEDLRQRIESMQS